MNRRIFVKKMISGLSGFYLLPTLAKAQSLFPAISTQENFQDDPHFFIQVVFSGGIDSSYLFDSRPLAMTQAKLIQNYLNEEPSPWLGGGNQDCLCTSIAKNLSVYKNKMTIVNGIVMATDFDGHTQNMDYLFTGSPFGGESYVPHLNQNVLDRKILDAVISGFLFVNVTNNSGIVPLSPNGTNQFIGKLKSSTTIDPTNPLVEFIQSRYRANVQPDGGRFTAANELLNRSFQEAKKVQDAFLGMDASGITDFQNLLKESFRKNLTKSCILSIDLGFDAHSFEIAKQQPQKIKEAVDQLKKLLDFLSNTSFDDKRTLLDVSTVAVATEFSRTMRTSRDPFDLTGTDHNPLTNSMMFIGKGVQGGKVIGASDFRSELEVLSGAHKKLDPEKLKTMGLPFDFKTQSVTSELPEAFDPSKYLTVHSVVNTIYELFGVDKKHYRLIGRNMPVAPTIYL